MMVNAGRERCGERSEEEDGESSDILSLALAVFGGVFLWTLVVRWRSCRVLFFLRAGDGHSWGRCGVCSGRFRFYLYESASRWPLAQTSVQPYHAPHSSHKQSCAAKFRTQFPGPSIEILGAFTRASHVSKRANHSESQGITEKKLLRHLASKNPLLLQPRSVSFLALCITYDSQKIGINHLINTAMEVLFCLAYDTPRHVYPRGNSTTPLLSVF